MIERTARALCSLEAVRQGKPSPEVRALLIQHEAADVGYRIVRAIRTPHDSKLVMADIAVDLGDLMVQVQMMAIDLGLDPDEVLKLGIRHTWERFSDFWPGGKA